MNPKVFIAGIALAAILFIGQGCTSKSTESDSGETPEMIEAAKNSGREAARVIITQEFTDSMEFHGAILEAASKKSGYQIEKQTKCEAAFDSAFISTIRTVRPDLARQLK